MSFNINSEYRTVFEYFGDICKIPHGSGNMKAISEFCVDFAKKHNLEYYTDSLNNVIIKKPASEGYENNPSVILQGHLDMVCEQNSGVNKNFLTEGINAVLDGGYIKAEGTTLGADNGIAVAIMLSILSDNTLKHPALEAVFTTDEETGMFGAEGLNTDLLSSKRFINLDSEAEGVLTAGCAGGIRADITLNYPEIKASENIYKITVGGLKGGHSGVEIHKNRLNANKVMAKLLEKLGEQVSVCEIMGGLKDNAIARECSAIISSEADAVGIAEEFNNTLLKECDEEVKITAESVTGEFSFAENNASKQIISLLNKLPNGVISYSPNIEGLVQTSLNLGVLKVKNGHLSASFALRSSLNAERDELAEALRKIANEHNAKIKLHSKYPAWEYKQASPLRDTFNAVYKNLFGKELKTDVIHAGLECGLFSEKIAGLDAVSIGPDIIDVHTPNEKLSVKSTERTYKFLCKVLESL